MPSPTVWVFDDGERDAGLVVEDVVGALRFAAAGELAADDDAALGEIDLLAHLVHHVPLAHAGDGGGDELGADVALAETLFWAGVTGGWG